MQLLEPGEKHRERLGFLARLLFKSQVEDANQERLSVASLSAS